MTRLRDLSARLVELFALSRTADALEDAGQLLVLAATKANLCMLRETANVQF